MQHRAGGCCAAAAPHAAGGGRGQTHVSPSEAVRCAAAPVQQRVCTTDMHGERVTLAGCVPRVTWAYLGSHWRWRRRQQLFTGCVRHARWGHSCRARTSSCRLSCNRHSVVLDHASSGVFQTTLLHGISTVLSLWLCSSECARHATVPHSCSRVNATASGVLSAAPKQRAQRKQTSQHVLLGGTLLQLCFLFCWWCQQALFLPRTPPRQTVLHAGVPSVEWGSSGKLLCIAVHRRCSDHLATLPDKHTP